MLILVPEMLPGKLLLALMVQVAFETKQEVPIARAVVAETSSEALAVFRIAEFEQRLQTG